MRKSRLLATQTFITIAFELNITELRYNIKTFKTKIFSNIFENVLTKVENVCSKGLKNLEIDYLKLKARVLFCMN